MGTAGSLGDERPRCGREPHVATECGAHVAFYIDLLREQGVHLDEPYTRQLRGAAMLRCIAEGRTAED